MKLRMVHLDFSKHSQSNSPIPKWPAFHVQAFCLFCVLKRVEFPRRHYGLCWLNEVISTHGRDGNKSISGERNNMDMLVEQRRSANTFKLTSYYKLFIRLYIFNFAIILIKRIVSTQEEALRRIGQRHFENQSRSSSRAHIFASPAISELIGVLCRSVQ